MTKSITRVISARRVVTWHLASKELPTHPYDCVVCMDCANRAQDFAVATYEGGKWIDVSAEVVLSDVAAWFYMPMPPVVEVNGTE